MVYYVSRSLGRQQNVYTPIRSTDLPIDSTVNWVVNSTWMALSAVNNNILFSILSIAMCLIYFPCLFDWRQCTLSSSHEGGILVLFPVLHGILRNFCHLSIYLLEPLKKGYFNFYHRCFEIKWLISTSIEIVTFFYHHCIIEVNNISKIADL